MLKLFPIVKLSIPIDGIHKIFKTVRFSEEGSNSREKEQNSYMITLMNVRKVCIVLLCHQCSRTC